MKRILVIFVEITDYNLARIKNVYDTIEDFEFCYVYIHRSISGHETVGEIPSAAVIINNSFIQMLKILKLRKWDFIIINGYVEKCCIEAILYSKICGIPYAIETDTQLNIPLNWFKRIGKKMYLTYLFSGNSYGFAGGTRQTELFYHYGMQKHRVFIMPMTVDIANFQRISQLHLKNEHKAILGFRGKKVILYVGRFVRTKNLTSLIGAFAQIKQTKKDAILCLIGKGEMEAELKVLTDRLGVKDDVQFVKYQLMPRLAEYYSAADVFVLPSEYEPWGLVVNESLACGTPVIASTAVGSVDDLIQPGINGDVYSFDDNKTLISLLDKWLSDDIFPDCSIINKWDFSEYRNRFILAFKEFNIL